MCFVWGGGLVDVVTPMRGLKGVSLGGQASRGFTFNFFALLDCLIMTVLFIVLNFVVVGKNDIVD